MNISIEAKLKKKQREEKIDTKIKGEPKYTL